MCFVQILILSLLSLVLFVAPWTWGFLGTSATWARASFVQLNEKPLDALVDSPKIQEKIHHSKLSFDSFKNMPYILIL